MAMEPWMFDRLVATGILRADGVTRRLSYGKCSECRSWVFRALDGDICAVAVTLECGEVDQLGEFFAITQGRRTYMVCMLNRPGKFAWCIEERRAYHVAHPVQARPVVIEHRCGSTIETKRLRMVRRGWPDECPF